MAKICISATGPDLDSLVDQVFGRCSYFLLANSETEELKAIINKAKEAERGAGVAAAQTAVNSGAKVVICDNIGPNAQMVLKQSGVKVISKVSGTIKEILNRFKKGELK
jgi:predicted Fe-Mo cluster-binding NifX family protein